MNIIYIYIYETHAPKFYHYSRLDGLHVLWVWCVSVSDLICNLLGIIQLTELLKRPGIVGSAILETQQTLEE
jgi:hypothetical protein